jgi:WD40 repeat protein
MAMILPRRSVLTGGVCAGLFSIPAGRAQQAVEGEALGYVESLTFSEDGSLLAAADSGHVSLWHIPSGVLLPGFGVRAVPTNPIALGFVDSGTSLCVVSEAGAAIFPLSGEGAGRSIPFDTMTAALSPVANRIAYTQNDHVTVLDISAGAPILSAATGLGLVGCLALSANGKYLAAGAHETEMVIMGSAPNGVPSRQAAVLDLASGDRRNFTATGTWFFSLAFAPDNSRLAAISYDHDTAMPFNLAKNTTLDVWDITSGGTLLSVPLDQYSTTKYPYLAFVHGNQGLVAAGGGTAGGDVAVGRLENGLVTHGEGLFPSFWAAAANPAGSLLALGGILPGVMLLRLPSLQPAGSLPAAGNAKMRVMQ